ncbi:MAG: hypothetical protein AB8B83_02390 [Bdellovibrionales bacterium]
MMFSETMHPARRVFRKFLIGILCASVLFLIGVIGLRIYYYDKGVKGSMQTALFEYDVLQHKARTWVADDEQDLVIINDLIKLGFFSRVYIDAGLEMLSDKADEGYAPAVARQAEIHAYLYGEPVQAP